MKGERERKGKKKRERDGLRKMGHLDVSASLEGVERVLRSLGRWYRCIGRRVRLRF